MSMMKVAYIGHKPVKTDNVASTGTVWDGYGCVREVPEEAARKLMAFPGVWELADFAVVTLQADQAEGRPHPAAQDTAADKASLLAVAHGMGIKIDGRSSAAKIEAAIQAAQQALN